MAKTQRATRRPNSGRVDAVDKEVLAFFNKVVVDGRYVRQFVRDPRGVAQELDVDLSKSALTRLKKYKIADLAGIKTPGGEAMSPAAVAIVVAAIIVLWSKDPRRVIVDKSGRIKL